MIILIPYKQTSLCILLRTSNSNSACRFILQKINSLRTHFQFERMTGLCNRPECHLDAYQSSVNEELHLTSGTVFAFSSPRTLHCAVVHVKVLGRDHALVPLPVSHHSAIVIDSSALIRFFSATVQNGLLRLAPSLWPTYHMTCWWWSVAIRNRQVKSMND